jgi:hypothetical protein
MIGKKKTLKISFFKYGDKRDFSFFSFSSISSFHSTSQFTHTRTTNKGEKKGEQSQLDTRDNRTITG